MAKIKSSYLRLLYYGVSIKCARAMESYFIQYRAHLAMNNRLKEFEKNVLGHNVEIKISCLNTSFTLAII